MAAAQHNFFLVSCPRDPVQNDVLNIFKSLTPPDCEFTPQTLWGIQSRKKKSTCKWRVLYVLKNPQTKMYEQGRQTQQLKEILLQSHPINCYIIDYEFYDNQDYNLRGWLFTWRIHCNHFPKFDKVHKEQLSMVNYV